MFYDFQGIQSVYILFIIAVLAIILLLFLLRLSRGKARSEHSPNLMMFSDIDKMKNEGLISEDEYRQIRSRAAERELARSRDEDRIEREMSQIEKVRINPDMARDLLSEEEIQRAARIKKELEELRQGKARQPALTMEPGPVVPTKPAHIPPATPKKTPAPRAVPSPGNRMSELDILLEQGAISKADYARLKRIVIKQEDSENQ